MPKDNEVDEKVVAFAVVVDGEPDYAHVQRWACESEASVYGDGPSVTIEPLYSAATVAALEAEVERLRTALECVAWTRKPGPIPSRVPGSVVEQMERIAINALTGARAK